MFKIQNDITQELNIHVTRPCRNKPLVYQVFAFVRSVLREGLKNDKDKVIVGLTMCKVYERQSVKGCNNYQFYGEIAESCPTPLDLWKMWRGAPC